MNYLFFISRPHGLFVRLSAALLLALGCSLGGCEIPDEEYSFNDDFDSIKYESIVNGTIVAEDEYTSVVALRMKSNICTGTLIDPNVVITAAHCVHYLEFDITEEPESITVYGGPKMKQRLSQAVDVLTHASWKGKIKKNSADLALIILKTPVSHTKKYCVRSNDRYDVGTSGFIVGYGREDKEGRSGTKRVGKTTVLDKKDKDGLIELGDPTGTCLGDSGGPFFTVNKKGQHALAGVTSFGSGSCSSARGGFNVNVVKYRKWIEKTVKAFTRRPIIDCVDLTHDADKATKIEQADDMKTRTHQDEEAVEGSDIDDSFAAEEVNVCQKYPEFCTPEEAEADYQQVYEDEVSCSFAPLRPRSADGSDSMHLIFKLLSSLF